MPFASVTHNHLSIRLKFAPRLSVSRSVRNRPLRWRRSGFDRQVVAGIPVTFCRGSMG